MMNHLWQSTAFAACLAVLAWALRKHRANVRYALWWSASVKFLIPFSLFVSFGKHAEPVMTPLAPALATAARQAAVPFQAIIRISSKPAPIDWTPWLLAAWALGFLAIVTMRLRAWVRIRAILRASRPYPVPFPIAVRSSTVALEPGLVGLWRSTIVLPEGIERHLTPSQLDAVLAHELCHAERRDNLLAAAHMAAEALFWFHPLVWWIGARLAETRELACDEAVLANGGNPRDYAEAILNVCRRYAASPLPCVSGVTGADLKKRLEAILSSRVLLPLNSGKKVLLAAIAMIAAVAPFLAGIVSAQSAKSFEVASVHRDTEARKLLGTEVGHPPKLIGDRLEYTGTVHGLIALVYNLTGCRDCDFVSGGPAWINTEIYRIDAKLPEGSPRYNTTQFQMGEAAAVNQMIQTLLAERFGLKMHRESKDLPVYTMTVAPGGHKLTATAGKMREYSDGTTRVDRNLGIYPISDSGEVIRLSGAGGLARYRMIVKNFTCHELAESLSGLLERPVLDRTGLNDRFDFTVEWENFTDEPHFPPVVGGPGLISAFGKQLGLRLEPAKGPVDVLVIDSIERPTAN